jgi:hypothetical protein
MKLNFFFIIIKNNYFHINLRLFFFQHTHCTKAQLAINNQTEKKYKIYFFGKNSSTTTILFLLSINKNRFLSLSETVAGFIRS